MNTAMNTTSTDRPYTLAAIATAQGAIKRTAQSWLAKAKKDHGEIGEVIGGTRHFSEAERDILVSYAAPPRPAKVEATAEPPRTVQVEAFPGFGGAEVYTPPEPRSVEIVEGNHRMVLDGPEIGGQITLAKFRGDLEVRTYADPVNEAAAALAMFDALEKAMDSDLDQSFAQLETTAETVQQVQAKAEALRDKQLRYQITQDILARLQNQKTSELTELLGKAQNLTGGGGQ